MPLYDYKVFDKEGNFICEREEFFKSHKDAKDQVEFVSDEGEIYFGYKQISLIAKTQGNWSGHGWFEKGLGTWVKNSKDRDRIASEKGLVAQDDASSNKHMARDLMEKKIAYNAYWDKRHAEFHNIVDAEMKKGFSRERAEQNASLEWGSEDKLAEDKKHFSDKVNKMSAPTNLTIK